MINGCLLGDGSIELSHNRKTAHFSFKQSLKNKDRVEEVSDILDDLSGKISMTHSLAPIRTKNGIVYDDTLIHYAYRVRSKSSLIFYELRELWYPNGKKRVPSNLEMNWVIFSHWYQDDGYNQSNRHRIRLSTEGFVRDDVEFLQFLLWEQLGILGTLQKSGNGFSICIGPSYYGAVIDELEQYIKSPCMQYKISKYQ